MKKRSRIWRQSRILKAIQREVQAMSDEEIRQAAQRLAEHVGPKAKVRCKKVHLRLVKPRKQN